MDHVESDFLVDLKIRLEKINAAAPAMVAA